MKKTKHMLDIEKRIGEPLNIYLYRMYEEKWKSSSYLGRKLRVNPTTIRRWLPKFGIEIRKREDYDSRRITRPFKEELDNDYNIKKRKVSEKAKEIGVCEKTIYRWMERDGIKRRNRSEFFSSNGVSKPSGEELEDILEKKSQQDAAKELGVDIFIIRRLRKKEGVFQFRKSKYDSLDARRELLGMMLDDINKDLKDLRTRDFRKAKRLNGKSYRGLLDWYLSHFRYIFTKAKENMVKDFYGML